MLHKTSVLLLGLWLLGAGVSWSAPKPGDPAPDFTVTSISGEPLALSSLRGKVVLLGMFHICVPCMNQAMEFEKVQSQINSPDLVVVGINTHGDSKRDVEAYLKQFPNPIRFSYYIDPEKKVNKAYVQRDMPTVIILDKNGVIRVRSSAVDASQLAEFLKKLL
jgi:cytochrome c biogenesis protein CcmG/thiol:disulfide interchange protein DsbE